MINRDKNSHPLNDFKNTQFLLNEWKQTDTTSNKYDIVGIKKKELIYE